MAETKKTSPDEERTTLSLSLTVADKKALKMIAAEEGITIAALVRRWIDEHRKGAQ